ncbi:MAG: redoxin domain-containing protein [Anaerolineae bacterium]|nr:redoxin domain-containing protein [Anaerolineae bacterium]
MRLDYHQFKQLGSEIVVIGPDGPNSFRKYWQENEMPFIGLADIGSKVANQYYQEVNLFKLGRMPALFILDGNGVVRYEHYADDMKDYPGNQALLEIIKAIQTEKTG